MPQSWWSEKRKILHHYDRLARIYDSLYGEEQRSKIESILKILKIGCEDLVLDLGCGTGLLIEYVAMKVNHFVGVDLSGESLKIAVERSRRLGVKQKVSLLQADVDNLPFRDDVFDKFFALTLLQSLPEP
ncbi:TPA: class I SAM-dependent methyltransferase, partial [Candidatus Bathyarchaeota archaeon]|nr:class I SAM-dependent methyltransferase [Candidatus Bathyarchaeota archaeon]